MARQRRSPALAALVSTLLSLYAAPVSACGPFFDYAIFVHSNHPDFPLEKFAAGQIGVLREGFAPSYHVVAYRWLTNRPLNKGEQAGATALWKDRLENTYGVETANTKPWLDARKKVPGVKKIDEITTYKTTESYYEFPNCSSNAFETAAKTLEQRIKHYGLSNSVLKRWVENQDRVFDNCSCSSKKTSLPIAPPAGADDLARADFAYQTAAANFYCGDTARAREQFGAIARDPKSPWRHVAGYLVARSMIRDVTIKNASPGSDDINKLRQAAAYIEDTLKNPDYAMYKVDFAQLLDYVQRQVDPEKYQAKLAEQLLKPGTEESFGHALDDFTYPGQDASSEAETSTQSEAAKKSAPSDELSLWITEFEKIDKKNGLAVETWKSKRNLPWLLAALSEARVNGKVVPELEKAAREVPPSSPGYLTARYFLNDLLINTKRGAEVQADLDKLLQMSKGMMPTSSRNLFLNLRRKLAASFDEFIKYSLRDAVVVAVDNDYKELSDTDTSEDSPHPKKSAPEAMFDDPTADALNSQLPLSLWQKLALNKAIAPALHRQIAAATFVRAALLDNSTIANELVPEVKKAYPQLAQYLEAYKTSADNVQRRFALTYLLSKAPGLSPYIIGNLGRREKITDKDIFQQNYWIPVDPSAKRSTEEETSQDKYADEARPNVNLKPILSADENAEALRQARTLFAQASPPRFMTESSIAFAKIKPADPRIPEALSRAVKLSRFGVSTADASKYSKTAFTFLRSKYPRSTWTKQTPYFY